MTNKLAVSSVGNVFKLRMRFKVANAVKQQSARVLAALEWRFVDSMFFGSLVLGGLCC